MLTVPQYGAEMMESSVKSISKPVIDRLPVNQLDQFACRQLDRVSSTSTLFQFHSSFIIRSWGDTVNLTPLQTLRIVEHVWNGECSIRAGSDTPETKARLDKHHENLQDLQIKVK